MHPAGITCPNLQPWVLLGAVSPLCPLHPCCVPSAPAFLGATEPWSPSAPCNQRVLQSRRRWHGVPLFLGPRSEEGNRKSQTLKNSPQNAASLSLLFSLRKGGELRQRAPAGASGSPCPAVEMLGGQMGLCGEAVSPPAPRLQGIPQFGWGHCPWSPARSPGAAEGVGVPAPRPAPKDPRKGVCWLVVDLCHFSATDFYIRRSGLVNSCRIIEYAPGARWRPPPQRAQPYWAARGHPQDLLAGLETTLPSPDFRLLSFDTKFDPEHLPG